MDNPPDHNFTSTRRHQTLSADELGDRQNSPVHHIATTLSDNQQTVSPNAAMNSVNRRKRARITTRTYSDRSSTRLDDSEAVVSSEVAPVASHIVKTPLETENQIISFLNTSKIDSELRAMIVKYVQSDSVVRCLELAGFTSPHVLACLDETQIHRLEVFVSHACTLIDPVSVRELFIGPIFSLFPEQFRLPSGAVCGLLLAAADIKRAYCDDSSSDKSASRTTSSPVRESVDVSCQTDCTLPLNTTYNTRLMFPGVYGLPNNPMSSAVITNPIPSQSVDCTNRSDPSDTTGASPDTVAMMAAAFQAAAAAAVTANSYAPQTTKPEVTPLSSIALTNSAETNVTREVHSTAAELAQTLGVALSSESSLQNSTRLVATMSGCVMPTTSTSSVGPVQFFEEEMVDLDRLKQHSSASATRLASRQFLNAHLVRGRDFDMEMEVSTTLEGVKRVTGIFYCHLCREKRERTSAVRFSIARNRYPVLSNVLSHLKTHFQYRVQLFTNSATLLSTPTHVNKLSTGDHMMSSTNNSFSGSSGLVNLGLNVSQFFDTHTLINSQIHSPSPAFPPPSFATLSSHTESDPTDVHIKNEALDNLRPSLLNETPHGSSLSQSIRLTCPDTKVNDSSVCDETIETVSTGTVNDTHNCVTDHCSTQSG